SVPYVSDCRRAEVMDDMVGASRGPGGRVIDVQVDAAHNRSVVTFVAEIQVAEDAIVAAGRVAVDRIDLTAHEGEHPRMGAMDVVPFVPFADTPMSTCIELAHRTGDRMDRALSHDMYDL